MAARHAAPVVSALMAALLMMACGSPGIDPRTLVNAGNGAFMDDEQQAYLSAVIADFGQDPCAAAERLRTRDVALGASLEVQLLEAYTVARSLCTIGVTSFEVGFDQLGRVSFTEMDQPEIRAENGLLLSGDFTGTVVPLQQGESRCGAAWTSDPINVAVLEESAFYAEAPDPSFRLLWVHPGASMNCADAREYVGGIELADGQLGQLYVMTDQAPDEATTISLQAGSLVGTFARFDGATIEQSFRSIEPRRNTPEVSICAGYLPDTPTLTVDFGADSGSVEVQVTSDADSVLYVADINDEFIDCNDDGPFGLDSYLVLDNLTGRVQFYVGAFSQGRNVEGTIVIRPY